jgi:hypothetical protein
MKDSSKIVANWFIRLLESTSGSTVARVGVMSIGCGLKGNCGGSHNQSHRFPTGRRR